MFLNDHSYIPNMTSSRLLEPEIKAKVINFLLKEGLNYAGATLLNEYAVDRHSRRLDLLLINDNESIAFEIKSEADSLRRLDGQIDKYLNFFDKLVLVAAPKHINEIMKVAPKNVAVWQVCTKGVVLKQEGKLKPITEIPNLLKLMTAKELHRLAVQLSLSAGYKTRLQLEAILQHAPLSLLREATFGNIKNRYAKANSLFWQSVNGKEVHSSQISLLSLYQAERLARVNRSKLQILTLQKIAAGLTANSQESLSITRTPKSTTDMAIEISTIAA